MYELPSDLSTLSAEELQALIDSGLDAFRGLNIGQDSDEATIAEGERIAPLITAVRAEQRGREDAATSRRDRAAALANVLVEPEVPTPVAETPPPAPEPVITPDEVIPAPTAETPAPAPAPEPVAASGTPAQRAAANAPAPNVPARRAQVASLTAAADVPGIPTGAPLDGLTAAADALLRRMRALPTTNLGQVRHRYGAAMIHREGYGDLVQTNDVNDVDLVWQAGREARLPGGSLVAAGGWCAPSETLYDLCVYETVDGILDTPEINVSRGGIRWTQGPDFGDIYDGCGFFLTEAEAVAGTAQKDCCIVECPPFEEIRLDAIGLCVKAPLLTQAAYPELTRRFLEGALVAHQHKVNAYMIRNIEAAAGPPVVLNDAEALSITLAAIELNAIGMRYRYRMAQNASIEVVAPFWLKALIRMDLGMRQQSPDQLEAYITRWFSERQLSVQWVYDYQDLVVDDCGVTIPETVDVLMYPAGTWVKGSLDVINIDAVYDSTGLEQNVYTALFMEEGILAVQRCTHTCAITVPICVSGRTGAADLSACLALTTAGGGEGGNNATGATAGSPGTFTPGGSVGPPNAAQANQDGLTASPTTAWTVGQYVVGQSGDYHWNGTTWTVGRVTA